MALMSDGKRVFDFDCQFYRRHFLEAGKSVCNVSVQGVLLRYAREYREAFGDYPPLEREPLDLFKFWVACEDEWAKAVQRVSRGVKGGQG